MNERRDYVALDWVAGEIQETLTQATQALQAYIANRDDTTKLRFCLTHIHQVHGTLKMVEFFGAALLAEEMEALAQALTLGAIHDSHIDDALKVLAKAIDHLPTYLDRVKESRRGLPSTLLPILNDLRAVRGQSLLSETALFTPDLRASKVQSKATKLLVEGNELKEVVHKLRQMFQIALLGLIRGQDVRRNVNYLAKVCARLAKLTAGRPPQPLWQVCIALLEGILNGSIEPSVAVKILLRQVDREIKLLLASPDAALDKVPAKHLLKNLLYYIACCKANSRYIKNIKNEYNLEASLLGDSETDADGLASPDNSSMQAVVDALSQEIGDIKVALASAGPNAKALTNILPLFRRISDTMAILGMGTTLKPIQDSHTQLAKLLATQDVINANDVEEILWRISEVEADLKPEGVIEKASEQVLFNDSEEAQEQLDGAFDSVVRESRAGLEQTKEAIIEFVATQWNHNCLTEVPNLLAQIQGSLAMVPLESAASIIKSCESYVNNVLLGQKAVPEWQMLDTLADAITSIDYYLERLSDDSNASNEGILDVAAESVAELGYPVSQHVVNAGAVDVAGIENTSAAQFESSVMSDAKTAHSTKETAALAEVIPFKSPASAESETPDSSVAANIDEADDDFDPEIVEIFIEEAAEVLETIEEYLPLWRADRSNEDASATVRRAFHTLKGSGRMVGAVDIGELAWAVENMLNRVLDNTFIMDDVRFEVITQVKDQVPAMVSAFENRQRFEMMPIQVLIEKAERLAKEQSPTFVEPAAEPPPVEQDDAELSAEHTIDEIIFDDIVSAEGTVEQTPDVIDEFTPEDTGGNLFETQAEQSLVEPLTPDDSDTTRDDIADVEIVETAEQSDAWRTQKVTAEGNELDAELLDIFAVETTTHLQILDDFIAHCKELAGPADLTDELQRALHTLKGSANMAGVTPVAMLITPVEHVIKELKACQLKVDAPIVAMLEKASGLIGLGIEQLHTAPMQSLPGVDAFVDELMALYKERITNTSGDTVRDRNNVPQAQNEFLSDALDRINEINDKLTLWHAGDFTANEFDHIEGAINKLIDQAENIRMISLAEFGQALQTFYRSAANFDSTRISDEFYQLASNGNDALVDMLDQFAGHQEPAYDSALLAQIQDYEFTTVQAPIEEGVSVEPVEIDFSLVDEVDLPHATETVAGEDDLVELLSEDSELMSDENVVEVDLDSLPSGVVSDMVEVDVSALSEPAPEDDLVDTQESTDITSVDYADLDDQSAEVIYPEDRIVSETDTASKNDDEGSGDIVTEVMTDLAAALTSEQPIIQEAQFASDTVNIDDDDDVDAEILEIFLEEADDLLEAIDEAIHKWNDDREGRQYLDDLQRILHTLKGGARLTNLVELGNLSHNFETFLINADSDDTTIDEAFLSEVQRYQDQLITQVVNIKVGEEPEPAPAMHETLVDVKQDKTPIPPVSGEEKSKTPITDTVLPMRRPKQKTQTEVVPFVASRPGLATSAATQSAPKMAETAAKKGPQEVVKVSAQLLEDLVNLAGETSISRGQAEEQISELVFSLDEMQITVDRLQEQVRRLDMETEQQILYRQEQVESEGLEGFDPLEMDRYSALQQLSRSLLESSSDLIDIKSTLSEKSRDMETLLVQQSRINTELQEGLMRSRMVPFSRMVPRLRRIVRQVSGELNKKVDFKLHNIEGELDRTVLERMVAPLEHMLRNAVDHGLETTEERAAARKPKKGTISLGLHREGGEIVLTLSDDGAGINLEAVKRKAIERGLMEPDANLNDHEISQFILQSGFSTATAVTQLSGRGVGMDVVNSEIKQLGGNIEIESKPGQGTSFIVRLPFTVSVNRALMVNVDGDIYAIPLNTIEGIVRVSPFELEAYYQPDAPMFEYAGQPYLLKYMGALLRRGEKPMLEGQNTPLPVVLVRGTDHSVAIQVDHLMGSREIVVKPLGPQFSLVQGLSGATVLGDGSVVVILDLLAMIRADALYLHKDFTITQEPEVEEERAICVMVVDDSVTVRKVTSRFLERQGMEVLLAKDGADAMTQLQEIDLAPDIILLDIEMPRMDGFEVASRIRHNSRLKAMPIIMITSRAGEKHRERALSLGVNYYMGKPYQEVELLETINSLTGITTE